MSTVATEAHVGHAEHHELGFIQTYIFSTDHKMIARQFLVAALFFLVVGGLLAVMVRWQLGFPGQPMPLGNLLPDTMAPGGILLPEFYNSLVTMHATFMVFFALMPMLAGVFGNLLIPLQIGADDMAFPRINMLSFWVVPPAGIIMLASFFVEGGAAGAGWTSYAPLSASGEWTGVYMGQILWLVSLIVLGFSSILGAINYVSTVINMRAPGMTWFRIPLATWALFITAWLLLLAVPILTGGLILLLFDQTIGTAFFRPELSGEPLLWQHIFWFFGHPEVYILILPAMGFVSDIIACRARKPIYGYHAMVIAIASIAFLGWIVWGHHMFQSGMNPLLGMTFMATTVVIAVPSAIKVFNWLGDAVAEQRSPRCAAPPRRLVRGALHHRRPLGDLHGGGTGRHLHPRTPTSSWHTCTMCSSEAPSSGSSRRSPSGTPSCSVPSCTKAGGRCTGRCRSSSTTSRSFRCITWGCRE